MSDIAQHIAVIGMAGRFPGAADVAEFWRVLVSGTDAIGHFSEAELEHPNANSLPGVRHVGARGVLDRVAEFDAEFFGITPREAELMDPQHRLFLQCCWHALEDAGRDPASFPGLIGVYAGVSLNTYLLYNLQGQAAALASSYQVGAYQTMLGNDKDFMPTRVSYKLGLRGPSMAVQTACSTSLVAVAQACQALLSYQADLCLAGGVSISFPQKRDYPYTEDAMVSPDGRCRPFDADAQGTVFGHGAGVVALRRLEDALADGDNILAVIRGSAVNNDGANKIGFAAPSVDGQADVIAMAQALADVDPTSISYIEAHGTGTPLGDPIEVAALTQAFRRATTKQGFCTIGTAKGNIGHLDVAAGVTGLIKTVLQLQHRQIPGVQNFRAPNPRLSLATSPFRIADRLQPWDAPRPLRAGVSAFGVGGTNAHVVLEEAPPANPTASARSHQLFLLSARTAEALDEATLRLKHHLTEHDQPLTDVAFTLQTGRRAFAHRRIVVSDSRSGFITALDAPSRLATGTAGLHASVAFLIPGQGAQHAGMAAGIYASEPLFRRELDRLCAMAEPNLGFDLRTVLYPAGDPTAAHERLRQTEVAQPALFIVSLALAKLWQSWGVHPQGFIGHSVGEYVAAVLAGVMSDSDAVRLVALRGRLIQSLSPGTMLSVRVSEAALLPMLPEGCSIAAINGAQLCVASGPLAAIATLAKRLDAEGIVNRPLKTSHAFHSPMMDAVLPAFATAMATVRLSAPTIPVVSCVSGTWLTAAEATAPDYWVRHVRATVRFADAVATLRRETQHHFLEIGPGRTLTTLARQAATDDARAMLASLPTPADSAERAQPSSDAAALMEAVGRLWLAGVTIDWAALHAPESRRRVSLPGYPFARTRFWISPPANAVAPPAACASTTTFALASSLEGSATMASAPPSPKPLAGGGRRSALFAALRTVLADLSGTPADRLDATASFIELGFDSLMLTQVSMALQSRFSTKISFRQLLGDLGSMDALLDHLDRTLPPDAFAGAPAPQVSLPPAAITESPLEQLIRRQMEMMAEQLALLKGGSAPPTTAISPAAQAKQPASAATTSTAGEFKAFGPYKPIQRGPVGGFTPGQQSALDRFTARYTQKTKTSKALTQQHRPHLADPRVAGGFRAQWKELVYPIITNRSKGTRLWDVDGNEYIDLLNGFGCIFFGHAPDFVVEAVNRQMSHGYEIGPQTLLAGEAAQLMCDMTGLDRTTFCNTGSEAVMAAMRLARTVTGRMRIVSFLGDYHGTFDEVLAKSVGEDHRSLPIAPGIPQGKVDNLTVLPYGTDETLNWIRTHAHELAAVLIEPVQSRHPALQPKAFIQEVRRITAASGTALIMDEVITGFRTHPGGAQALFGVKADLASYGKVIGGGMPIGVLCGSRRFMDALDGGMWQYGDDSFPEVGVTFFAGTFVRHPATMAAVVACLQHLKREGPALQARVDAKCTRLVERLNALFQQRGVPTTIEHFSSYFYFTFAPEHRNGSLIYYLLRDRGVHIQEGFPCFLTTAHTDDDLERIYQAFVGAVDELVTNGFFPDPSGRVNEHERDQPVAVAPVTTASRTSAPISGPLALSESQREIWLAAQFDPQASCAYNESVTLRLTGDLQPSHLETAWFRLVERHSALRIRIAADGETQEVVDGVIIPLVQHDLRGAKSEERLAALIASEAETPFDLARGPLVRVHLVRLDDRQHAVVLTAHHLICDGWSMNVLCDEWGRAYSALIAGMAPALAATCSFPEYVAQVLQRQEDPAHRSMVSYWRQRFSSVPSLPDLPSDRPRPAQRSYLGATIRRRIARETYQAIRQVAARHKATLFTTLLSGFQVLIARLTEQWDVVVGVPTAGQALLGTDGDFLVGHCVNFLPLRAMIDPQRSLAEQLPQLQRQVLEDFDRQECTYGQLVRALRLTRDPNRNPLTEVQFNLERWASAVEFSGLQLAFTSNPKRFVTFDLFLNVVEDADGLHLHLDYNRGLYDEVTMQRWLGHYESLLSAFAQTPTTTVATLPLLTPAERHAILSGFNRSQSEYVRRDCVHDLISRLAKKTPDAIAIVAGSESLSYQALNELSSRLAALLATRGIGRGSAVAICLPRSTALPIAVLAVLKAGGCYVPLDARYPASRIQQIVDDARPALVISESDEWQPFGTLGIATLLLDDGWQKQLPSAPTTPSPATSEDVAYLLFTSGSTGRPKGVQVPHRAVVNLLHSMRERPGITASDTLLAITTLSFDIHVAEILLPLSVGARVVLAESGASSDPKRLLQLLGTSKATIFQATPITMRMLVEAGWSGDGRIRLWCGGEAIPRDLADSLLARAGELWNGYGPTETTVYSSLDRVERSSGPVLMGSPVANTRLHILDPRLQPVPIGVMGEIYIGGDGMAHGYLGRADLTAERFIRDPLDVDSTTRLYRTGDLGRYLPDGRIEYLGRTDHQVKIRGFRIELGDIEQAIGQYPGIRERVVIARGEGANRHLVAFIVCDTSDTVASLRPYLRERLPEYMVPAAIVRLDALPLTPNGKVDRKALPATDQALSMGASANGASPTPSISLHFHLLQVWEEILSTRGLRLDDDFFAIGGNSLLAFRMMNTLEQQIGRRLPMALLFKHPTILRLSEAIMAGSTPLERPVLRVQEGNRSNRPFFFLHGDYLGGGYYCVSLARRLGQQVPFYALVPKSIDLNRPIPSISELAASYLEEIRTICPHGPYQLGGFCIGGNIAHEMARQLRASGEQVSLLLLIDSQASYPAERWARRLTRSFGSLTFWDRSPQLSLFARLNQRIERLKELTPLEMIQVALTKAGLRRDVPTAANASQGFTSSRLHTVQATTPSAYAQLNAYLWTTCVHVPKPLDIPVHLIASDEYLKSTSEPTAGWTRTPSGVHLHQIAGGHLESITRNLPKIVDILRPMLAPPGVTEAGDQPGRTQGQVVTA